MKKSKTKGKTSAVKKLIKILIAIVAAIVIVVAGYVGYVFIDYHRVADNYQCEIADKTTASAAVGTPYTIMAYNVGFGAYTPDFGFFMDGGTESRAKSKESVISTIKGAVEVIKNENPDFIMIEELDKSATRSYHVNQPDIVLENITDMDSTFAVNYDSPYLFYPVTKPHGKTLAGIMTMSKFNIENSIRRSLPIESGFMKLLDLDRCYDKVTISVDGGKQLVLFTLHLSAYTSDGKVVEEQLKMLLDDITEEYNSGKYVICGGDFNKDLLGNSSEIFGVDGSDFTWAQSFPFDTLQNTPFTLEAPLTAENGDIPVATCRNADGPYTENQFRITIDGFIVSDNIDVLSCNTVDTGFAYSDHNPVKMTFVLK